MIVASPAGDPLITYCLTPRTCSFWRNVPQSGFSSPMCPVPFSESRKLVADWRLESTLGDDANGSVVCKGLICWALSFAMGSVGAGTFGGDVLEAWSTEEVRSPCGLGTDPGRDGGCIPPDDTFFFEWLSLGWWQRRFL